MFEYFISQHAVKSINTALSDLHLPRYNAPLLCGEIEDSLRQDRRESQCPEVGAIKQRYIFYCIRLLSI